MHRSFEPAQRFIRDGGEALQLKPRVAAKKTEKEISVMILQEIKRLKIPVDRTKEECIDILRKALPLLGEIVDEKYLEYLQSDERTLEDVYKIAMHKYSQVNTKLFSLAAAVNEIEKLVFRPRDIRETMSKGNEPRELSAVGANVGQGYLEQESGRSVVTEKSRKSVELFDLLVEKKFSGHFSEEELKRLRLRIANLAKKEYDAFTANSSLTGMKEVEHDNEDVVEELQKTGLDEKDANEILQRYSNEFGSLYDVAFFNAVVLEPCIMALTEKFADKVNDKLKDFFFSAKTWDGELRGELNQLELCTLLFLNNNYGKFDDYQMYRLLRHQNSEGENFLDILGRLEFYAGGDIPALVFEDEDTMKKIHELCAIFTFDEDMYKAYLKDDPEKYKEPILPELIPYYTRLQKMLDTLKVDDKERPFDEDVELPIKINVDSPEIMWESIPYDLDGVREFSREVFERLLRVGLGELLEDDDEKEAYELLDEIAENTHEGFIENESISKELIGKPVSSNVDTMTLQQSLFKEEEAEAFINAYLKCMGSEYDVKVFQNVILRTALEPIEIVLMKKALRKLIEHFDFFQDYDEEKLDDADNDFIGMPIYVSRFIVENYEEFDEELVKDMFETETEMMGAAEWFALMVELNGKDLIREMKDDKASAREINGFCIYFYDKRPELIERFEEDENGFNGVIPEFSGYYDRLKELVAKFK